MEESTKKSFKEKFDNFWYHYKWHTIVAAALVFVITLLAIQMMTKTKFDAHILYAGNHEISRASVSGDIPDYKKLTTTLSSYSSDRDDDGNVNIDLRNLFVLNNEERAEILKNNPDAEINESLVDEDTKTLYTILVGEEYYLCMFSERLFLDLEERYEGKLFSPLDVYTENEKDFSFAGDAKRGIYISSIDSFYSRAEISKLPEDTVIALRARSEVSSLINKKKNEEAFFAGEQMLKNILADD